MSTIENWLPCVGAGWHPLIRELIADLEKLGWDGYISQIKEKFGGLRFYIGQGTDELFNRIDRAETDSKRICELCGDPGETVVDLMGWYRTRCEKHRQEN